eukprot:546530-Amphidinium_carterae.1
MGSQQWTQNAWMVEFKSLRQIHISCRACCLCVINWRHLGVVSFTSRGCFGIDLGFGLFGCFVFCLPSCWYRTTVTIRPRKAS